MAYSAPELLLVGAAQQLVLEGSPANLQKEILDVNCDIVPVEDGVGRDYDLPAGW